MVHGYITSYKSKKDGGDWLPEITKANRNRQPVVHVERLILDRVCVYGRLALCVHQT